MGKDSCQGCRDRDAIIADLQQQLAALQAEVRELQARVNQNASNSSLPPSANPPQAPKPVTKNHPHADPEHNRDMPRKRDDAIRPTESNRSSPSCRIPVDTVKHLCPPNKDHMTPNPRGTRSPNFPN